MPLIDLLAHARDLPAWQSSVTATVGPANIKVLKMDERAYAEETHDYNEALLVLEGKLLLQVGQQVIAVGPGQLYLALAGVAHAVLPGSHGTLLIVDV